MDVEMFFREVERRAEALEEGDREVMAQRIALAREFAGSSDPLSFLRSWLTPGERYRPRFEDAGDERRHPDRQSAAEEAAGPLASQLANASDSVGDR